MPSSTSLRFRSPSPSPGARASLRPGAPPAASPPPAASLPRAASPSRLAASLSLSLALSLVACASGGTVESTTGPGAGGVGGASTAGGGAGGTAGAGGATDPTTSTGGSTTTTGPAGFTESACPAGSYATGLDLERKLVCQPIAPAVREGVNSGCSLYLGWRDSCTGCDLPPTKWGFTSPSGCQNGAGADDTCTAPTLDGAAIQLFGLNFDGDVNSDDKIHLGLDCPAVPSTPEDGPCPAGSYAVSLAGDTPACVPSAAPVLDHVRARCALYFGWRDSCDACTSAPDRWGAVGPTSCTVGSGDTSTCGTHTLGGADVQLFGLSTGGDVDGNDKLYLALHCDAPQAASTATKGACPAGQLITAVTADGTFTCESPAPAVAAYFDDHCTFYFGLRDGCDGCGAPPAKWGRVKNGFCTNDNGVDNTCTQTILGGKTLEMFGLNPDGDVDGNDKLYAGFRCD